MTRVGNEARGLGERFCVVDSHRVGREELFIFLVQIKHLINNCEHSVLLAVHYISHNVIETLVKVWENSK